jgi:hypothetical protein
MSAMPPIVVRNVSGTILPVDESKVRVTDVPLRGEEMNILNAPVKYKSETGSERFVYRINCRVVDADQLTMCIDAFQQQVLFICGNFWYYQKDYRRSKKAQ